MTGRASWSRLFNETLTSLRFDVDGEQMSLEPALNLLSDPNAERRKSAAEALAKVFRENARVFTLVTNTLAKDKEISDRWRGFPDVASSRHLANRVEHEVVDALVAATRESYPRLSHRYYALEGQMARRRTPELLGPQRANQPRSRTRHSVERRAPHGHRGISSLLAIHGENR